MLTWLRSLVFELGFVVSTLVWAPLCVLTFPLPFVWRYRFVSLWSRFNVGWLRISCGISYRVRGQEHIPAGPAIIMAKHQSTWETLALQIIFPPQVWVLKRELLHVPFFGWGLAVLEPIAIDRSAGRTAVRQVLEEGTARLRAGRWIVIFPEGTRVAPGVRGRYGIGGAMLAARSGYPIVPVAHNAGEFWSRKALLKRPGMVEVVIGPVIEPGDRSPGELREAVEEWIEGEMARLPHPYRPIPEAPVSDVQIGR
jgi:1-acyl-sn-glycerol-3-phosphate acyltransferase